MIQPIKNFRCGLPLLVFTAAFFLGLGSFAGFYLKESLSKASNLQFPTPAPQAPTMLVSEEADKDKIPADCKAAVTALKQFLAATTVDERLRYTLGGKAMKPQMERYYQQAAEKPETEARIDFVRTDPNTELGSGRHCVLSLESEAWEFAVPVMLEEKADGFKVDWVAFVEFKDRLLERFFKSPSTEPLRFRVGIQRVHYFEDGVPNISSKDCFLISPAPPNSFQGHVFLEKDSELAKKLRVSMPWEDHQWAMVELEWKKKGQQQWVELKKVPQMHWYQDPAELEEMRQKQ